MNSITGIFFKNFKMPVKKTLLLLISLIYVPYAFAQQNKDVIRIGFDFLAGNQLIFPFNDINYSHTQKGYRLQINYLLRNGKFSYELQIEPSYYKAEHRMLNPDFILPTGGVDYMAERVMFMKERTINEYALNIGLVTRYNFNKNFSSYLLLSTGPMYTDKETERLAQGFAFSNLISLGLGYSTGRLRFQFGPGIRHVSNANTHFPNGGHNSSTLDGGVTFLFK
jgi:hypothetical protein